MADLAEPTKVKESEVALSKDGILGTDMGSIKASAIVEKTSLENGVQINGKLAEMTVDSWRQLPLVVELLQRDKIQHLKLTFKDTPATDTSPAGNDLKEFICRLQKLPISEMINAVERKLNQTGHEDLARVMRESDVYDFKRKDKSLLKVREVIDVSKLDPASGDFAEKIDRVKAKLVDAVNGKIHQEIAVWTSPTNQSQVFQNLEKFLTDVATDSKNQPAVKAILEQHLKIWSGETTDKGGPKYLRLDEFAAVAKKDPELAEYERLSKEVSKLQEARRLEEGNIKRREKELTELGERIKKVEAALGPNPESLEDERKTLKTARDGLPSALKALRMKDVAGFPELDRTYEELLVKLQTPAGASATDAKLLETARQTLTTFHTGIHDPAHRLTAAKKVLEAVHALPPALRDALKPEFQKFTDDRAAVADAEESVIKPLLLKHDKFTGETETRIKLHVDLSRLTGDKARLTESLNTQRESFTKKEAEYYEPTLEALVLEMQKIAPKLKTPAKPDVVM